MHESDKPADVLTLRELTVMRMVCGSLTSVEIADKLQISTRTVETHRTNIYDKLQIDNVVQLIRWAIRQGEIKP